MTAESRTVAFLTDTDRPRLLELVAREVHHHRRGLRVDHLGPAEVCDACHTLADSVMQCVGRRVETEGWTATDEVLDALTRRKPLRRSVLSDAERMVKGELGLRSRPDRDARVWFRQVLERASAAGELCLPVRAAERLVEWAISYASDPYQRPEPGAELPFGRLARSLSAAYDLDCSSDDVATAWREVVAACASDPAAFARLDRLVLGRGDRVDIGSLVVHEAGGDEVSLDEVAAVSALHPSDWQGDPLDVVVRPQPEPVSEPGVVDRAAAEVRAWLSGLTRRPGAKARRAEAADRVRAVLVRCHPAITDEPGADRFLRDDEPAFAELVDQVLAEIGA